MPVMEERRLRALVAARIRETSGGAAGGRNVSERRAALRHYRGEPFGNEQEGRSQVVSRDLAEAVDGMMPSLMRVFAGGDQVVQFEPRGPEDEAAAAQASDYVNWIWSSQNDGFSIFHTWFKDALLFRLGVVKIWWDEGREIWTERYAGLTDGELDILLADPAIEAITDEARPDPERPGECLHDVTLKVARPEARVRIAPVPPEAFLVDAQARSLDEAGFLGHRQRRTVSDLVSEGHDAATLARLADAQAAGDATLEHRERFRADAAATSRPDLDPAQRLVTVSECYLRVDWDGDGHAELRRVLVAGEDAQLILANDEVDSHPFAALTPIPMPHALIGRSIADQVMDLQLVKSTLLRQMLDNLYLTNNPEKEVVEGQVNLDDLLTSRPGGLKRVKAPGSINVLATPFVAGAAFPMLEYIDAIREQRTGITRLSQGLDADTLNRTATGISLLVGAGQQRLELIARIFAETGVRQAFRRILELVLKHEARSRTIRLRGRWVEIDPRAWRDGFDLSVVVGIGTGSRDQQVRALMDLLAIDRELVALQGGAEGPLLTSQNLFNQLSKLAEAMGLKGAERYFTDPSGA